MESYRRPKYLNSAKMTLPLASTGSSLNITHAYGGPIQLVISSTSPVTNVTVRISNVGKHPVWRSSADTEFFTQGINDNIYSWAELITPGFIVHSRMSLMYETLSSPYWPTPDLLSKYTFSNFYQVRPNLMHSFWRGIELSFLV